MKLRGLFIFFITKLQFECTISCILIYYTWEPRRTVRPFSHNYYFQIHIFLRSKYTLEVPNFGNSKSKKKYSKFFFRNIELGFGKNTNFRKKKFEIFFEFRNSNYRIREKCGNSYSKFRKFRNSYPKFRKFRNSFSAIRYFEILIR